MLSLRASSEEILFGEYLSSLTVAEGNAMACLACTITGRVRQKGTRDPDGKGRRRRPWHTSTRRLNSSRHRRVFVPI